MATLGKIVGLVKASATRPTKLMGVNNSTLARFMGVGLGVQATGGTITYSGSYTIHKFTADGTLTVNTGGGQASGDVEYLVAGGGGGGGDNGGGAGGGGGFRTGTGLAAVPPSYSITVGAGGVINYPSRGTQGGSSIFSTITSPGGPE